MVTFGFAPTVDTEVTVEAVRKKRLVRGTSVGNRQTIRTVKKVTVRRGDGGFRWSVSPVSFSVHGQPASPVDELIEGLPFTYRFDAAGALLAVEGYDDLVEKGKALLGAEAEASTTLDPEAARRARMQAWRDRVGPVVGKKLVLDRPFVGGSMTALGEGEVYAYTVTTVGPFTKCALGTCIRVTIDASSDPVALSTITGVKLEPREGDPRRGEDDQGHEGHGHGHDHPGHGHDAQEADTPEVVLRYHVMRFVEPATGMPVWERMAREVDVRAVGKMRDEVVLAYRYPR